MLKSHFDMKDFSETNFILKKYKNMWWNISWSITLCWENIIFMITAAPFDSSVHLFLAKFSCILAISNPVFRWESCKGSEWEREYKEMLKIVQ